MAESRKEKSKRTTNWWKWAFIVLVLLLVFGLFQLVRLVQPVNENEPNLEVVTPEETEMVLGTTTNRQDAEQFIQAFLTTYFEESNETNEQYVVTLDDSLNIIGELEVFQFSVPFTLSFVPFVLENGNVQLRGQSVQIGGLSLPVSAVINLMANQLEIPEYVSVNGDDASITINLNELSVAHNIRVEMVRIDLPHDTIEMNLYIDETIFNQMNAVDSLTESSNQ